MHFFHASFLNLKFMWIFVTKLCLPSKLSFQPRTNFLPRFLTHSSPPAREVCPGHDWCGGGQYKRQRRPSPALSVPAKVIRITWVLRPCVQPRHLFSRARQGKLAFLARNESIDFGAQSDLCLYVGNKLLWRSVFGTPDLIYCSCVSVNCMFSFKMANLLV